MSAAMLVVDDNAALADNLTEILTDAGYFCRTAHSCGEALTAAEHGFDVALVDLKLPDGDGTSLAAQLREKVPEGEVVMLTGFASVETAARAVRAGAFAYLLKPVAPPELLLTVEQALRQVRLHTEKRELARRTQRAEKLAAVGTLTAGLSHEIRNPLNAASLQLSVLERRVEKLPDANKGPLLEPLKLVRDEIRRLDHILQDFLLFARPRDVAGRPTDVSAICERVVSLLQPEAERRKLTLKSSPAPKLPLALADEGQLQQVVMNLTLNALEALGERGSRVELTSSLEGQQVQVTVDDDGPGIPLEQRERIFEPFFTTKAQGTGLGLAIVHTLITQQSGTLTVDDSPLGGARFTVRLPVARSNDNS